MFEEFDISVENIKRLTDIHIARYSFLLQKAKEDWINVRPDECIYLLGIWKGIEAKKYNINQLGESARYELHDALVDELE